MQKHLQNEFKKSVSMDETDFLHQYADPREGSGRSRSSRDLAVQLGTSRESFTAGSDF